MAAQDQAARKDAFVKLQRFVVEQALQLVQYISPAVAVVQPEGAELQGQPARRCRSSTEVWLEGMSRLEATEMVMEWAFAA